MSDRIELKEVDQVEILSLSDNYNDLVTMDSNEIVTRAVPVKDMEVKGSILAEHGFSAVIKTTSGEETHELFFDFGLSDVAVPYNVNSLGVDISGVEAAVLSHGHMDHFGALVPMIEAIPTKPLPFYVHPSAFKENRYLRVGDIRIKFPPADRAAWEKAGADIVESQGPTLLAGDTVLFLGEIERLTDFERGMPNAYFDKDGEEIWDPIEEDSGIVVNVRGKGLVVLSGCSHSGIVNTVTYARKVTGVDKVHVVMGGFHLTGPAFEPIIDQTIEGLQAFDPDYVVPTHCTGRNAVMAFEKAMPEEFILNMAGTRLTFRA
ncbi:MAG: MBL fold metallo-hydrolase [Actinobacteria bacterium]|nr:MBL fold metallo-hydrolase [Actinomycetota bacterium]